MKAIHLRDALRVRSRFASGLRRPARPSLLALLLAWQERARERHHLQSLDDRLLRDMGLSRADVAREANKPFWRS